MNSALERETYKKLQEYYVLNERIPKKLNLIASIVPGEKKAQKSVKFKSS